MKSQRRLPFTARRLDRLIPPVEGRDTYRDTKAAGLVLVVGQQSQVFYLVRRIGQSVRRVKLGTYPAIGIAEARARVTARSHAVNRGEPILAGKVTLRDAWQAYLTHKAAGNKTRGRAVRQWQLYLEPWAEWRLADFTPTVVSNLKRGVVELAGDGVKSRNGGQTVANRVLSLLSAIFTQARKHCGWRGGNPVADVDRYRENRRTRYLGAAEAGRLFRALDDYPDPTVSDALYLCLWTGARKGNVLAMNWRDVDAEAGVWTIRGEVSKTGEPVRVVLVEQAQDVLRRRHEATGGVGWVFPSFGRSGHLAAVNNAWKRILGAAGITERLTIHDLRHSAASWAYQQGASLGLIGDQLGHRSESTTRRYAHPSDEAIREAMGRGADAIAKAASGA